MSKCGRTAGPSAQSGSGPRPCPQRRPSEQPATTQTTRRTTLLSVAALAWAPSSLLDSLRGEAGLWVQEAQLYGRKASSALSEATGAQQAALEASTREAAAAAASLTLDPALAAALLAAPLQALRGPASGDRAATAGTGATQLEVPVLPVLDRERYDRDYAALLQQELPYFKQAGTCGQCGAAGDGPGALSDRAYFDFVAYIQWKALARQLGATLATAGASTQLSGMERMHAGSPEMQLRSAEQAWQDSLRDQALLFAGSSGSSAVGGGTQEEQLRAAAAAYRSRAQQAAAKSGSSAPKLSQADALRLAVGGAILAHIEADLAAELAGSTRNGGSGGSGLGEPGGGERSAKEAAREALAAMRETSAELDSIRAGAQALLAWFTSKGFVASAACEHFGLSRDEYENHYVWAVGEPAFLKYWLERPASQRSAAALDQEEGFSQDYVASTLQAYFLRCGVVAGTLKRYPSYSEPNLVAEQWTLRRVAPLPEGHDWQQYREWRPDTCPGGDLDACQ